MLSLLADVFPCSHFEAACRADGQGEGRTSSRDAAGGFADPTLVFLDVGSGDSMQPL